VTDPRIQALLSDRERLKSLLPAILEHAERERPLWLEKAEQGWVEQVEDTRAYVAGQTQQTIGGQRVPPISRQRVDRRVLAVARHVLERHPEMLEGGEG
jgi:hypothetical protein